MSLALSDLVTPLSVDDATESIYSVLTAVGVDVTTWKPGAVLRTLIAGVAIVVAGLSQLTAQLAQSGFLDTAVGDWLTLVARYVFGVERIAATQASGNVTLANSGGGIYTLSPGDLVVANTITGKTYTNTSTVNIPALSSGIVTPVVSQEFGAATTAQAHEITSLVTNLLGVSVDNASALVGTDDELDDDLRTRCKEKLGVLSPNGPSDAYAFIARSALRADGTPVGVTRVRTFKDGTGNVFVYVATATGGVAGSLTDTTTDLGAVNAAILKSVEPLGVTALLSSANPVTIAVTYEVWLYAVDGLTDQQIKDAIAANLAKFMSGQPIGGNVIAVSPGKIFVSAIEALIGSTTNPISGAPLKIFKVAVTLPAADVVLGQGDVPTLGIVTATNINQQTATGL